jgi:hypothetical protein
MEPQQRYVEKSILLWVVLCVVIILVTVGGTAEYLPASPDMTLRERVEQLEKVIAEQQEMLEEMKARLERREESTPALHKEDMLSGSEDLLEDETNEKITVDNEEYADPLPHGDSQVAEIGTYRVRIGLQYRIMYNNSNIPLLGVTTPADTESYDFFRQRMRFNIDVQPSDNVGGFLQLEYRGGWGGTSPASSDPRGAGLSLNAYNRLEARGVRYGYIYYVPRKRDYVAAGILPVSDQLGDTLFSADWDFNVGGITYNSVLGKLRYRLAYLRMVDGVASSDRDVVGENSDLFVADAHLPVGESAGLG